jgi:SAM-dependent methyltransferase
VLEYSDVPRALAELARVLRPGGCAVVSYPNPYAAYGIWKARLWYPVARAVRRALHRPHSHLPRGADTLPPKAFSAALGSAGFELRRFDYASFLLVLTPLERLAPAFAVWLGERFEGRGDRLGRVLATQIVYSALKTRREQA